MRTIKRDTLLHKQKKTAGAVSYIGLVNEKSSARTLPEEKSYSYDRHDIVPCRS